MILFNIAKRNLSEAFVTGFFNLGSLAVILLPLIGVLMLWNSDERVGWRESAEAQEKLSNWSINSGDGVIEFSLASPDYLKEIPVQGDGEIVNCAVGIGRDAPERFVRYAESLRCNVALKDSSVTDDKTVNIVFVADDLDSQNKNTTTEEYRSSIDATVIYLLLVYLIVIIVPCLICFWNISKIFDMKWKSTAQTLLVRGVPNRKLTALLCAGAWAGLIISCIVSFVPLYFVSRALENVVWEGTRFLPQDSLVGYFGALIIAGFITLTVAVVIYLRRMRYVAEIL
ncbi:hypothetical protein [Corynebacterium propinquum]|uniref:hypothetical protein n=1 Tax=Corynebacterium propinquum TaxID=43769 RepID=UPI001EF1B6D7|nr:hypothetical protein [Corynebacterium propinquum]MCG7232307.1 hypothetical protein [Corynebacterium propinquum]MDK4303578.1 hypothetical protein [Corynebacterium propinquum]WKS44756.1 hypothetical protein NLL36_09860 [Corynebacterium propinquum]